MVIAHCEPIGLWFGTLGIGAGNPTGTIVQGNRLWGIGGRRGQGDGAADCGVNFSVVG